MPEVSFVFLPDLNILYLLLSYFMLISNVAHVRQLEKENAALKRALEEKDKETAARDQYDKALADRLSIVAEGLAGDKFKPCS